MTHLALSMIPNDEPTRNFMVVRAMAIVQYAQLESSLAGLFTRLLGVTPDIAGVPFFKINNARSRNSMLKKLLRERHGSTYNVFFNPLIKYIGGLDDSRNQIIHWATAQ